MMDIAWQIVGGVFVATGIIGCVVPVVPGPVIAYCGLLCLLPTANPPTAGALAVFGAATALVVVLDYVVPAIGARKFNCSKLGVVGCAVGTVVGIFFLPLGIVLGPFLGAVVGELVAGKTAGNSIKGGVGALLGFLAGTFLKLLACVAMAVFFTKTL